MTPKQARPTVNHPAPEQQEGTRLESDDEIRQALQARRARLAAPAAAAVPGAQAKAPMAVPVEIEPQAEQPVLRPPVALLCVLDDGKTDGEWVRLRADRTVIGRTEGEVRIPHDGAVSGQHAELVRQRVGNGFRWCLADLKSTNGTFVRIGSTFLRHENEFLIGTGRYRFEASASAAVAVAPPGAPLQTTQAWNGAPIHSFVPSLVEMGPAGPLRRINLTLPEYWIGRDAKSCPIARPDDVLVNARHARLYRDAKGQWHIENNKSLNGLWFRLVEPMPLGSACQFRMGEQRFIFRMK
ncbi:MAG TPA: FHA domain-containing protein [Gemmataceae bacterium]|nr:FHA domain-containing protein [Gemmataceae bacterium]